MRDNITNLLEVQSPKEKDKKILSKKKKIPTKLVQEISQMSQNVTTHLGKYKDNYLCIQTKEELSQYIDKCIDNGLVAIDTETTGLDPMIDTIVGFSLYTPTEKAIYVPINHIDFMTQQRLDGQLTADECGELLRRFCNSTIKVIMFNANFDLRVFRHQLGIYLNVWWDGYLAQRCLNENELHNNLKDLHNKYVAKSDDGVSRFNDLFEKGKFNLVPIEVAYIYAARDAEITYELYKYQEQFLDPTSQKCIDKGLQQVASVFRDIEMPLIPIVADMEDTGVKVDLDYLDQLSAKYNKLLLEKEAEFYGLCDKYNTQIEAYRKAHPNNKLGSMINIASPTQIAILLYDILGEKPVPKQPARGTGEEVLKAINNEFCKAILEYREVSKLITTYIDKMRTVIHTKDKKVHCIFNQYGADTGRFSSKNPNMQNIPSHNKDIRKMFVADDGYVLMSADYSQQEPKVMTQLCGDQKMLDAYKQGKDLYAEIAALAFDQPYNECLEHFPKGTFIKQKEGKWYYATFGDFDKIADGEKDVYNDGKERRTQAKSILLGILYGRGIASIAEQLKCTKEKAQNIQDKVFKGFPAIKKFEEDSKKMAREKGYVDTLWGRKRRLPDMQLPKYAFYMDTPNQEECTDEALIRKYTMLLNQAYGRNAKDQVRLRAGVENLIIEDNSGYIAQAERQCVNARVQGSAADMSKKAMIVIGTDKRLRELGFQLLIPVHDELIAQCPIVNAKECKERFARLMSEAAKDKLEVPISCDVEVTKAWYGEGVEI